MPAGRPRTWIDNADKQQAYRERVAEKREEEHQIAERAKGLVEIALRRGIVLNHELPIWAQLDELKEYLSRH